MAPRLLDRIRAAGFEVEADGEALRVSPAADLTREQREALREHRDQLRAKLIREAAVRELDLVPVDAATGLPELSAEEPATERQAERLRELARDPALAPHRERVREIMETALGDGLSELGAWGLIGYLGGRAARRERPSTASSKTVAPAQLAERKA